MSYAKIMRYPDRGGLTAAERARYGVALRASAALIRRITSAKRGCMGASGWDYRAPYAGSVEATLIAVQEQVLMSGDYIWPWDTDPDFPDEDEDESEAVPRPSSLADLATAKEIGEFWDEGTHSILDIDRIVTADHEHVGAIFPLSPAELSRVFGTQQPSAADFDRVYQPGPSGPLARLLGERWSGRSMVIYDDANPAEVYFWGFSGD